MSKKVAIPQIEILRTAKALVLERALGWQRQLDKKSSQWQWRGASLDEQGSDTGWLTSWDELPDLLGDLAVMHIVLQKVVIANVAKGCSVALIYNPREPDPWICRFTETGPAPEGKMGDPVMRSQVSSNNQVAALLMGILAYYGINPLAHHRTYYPLRHLEVVGHATARQGPRDGSAIIVPGPGRARNDDGGGLQGPSGAARDVEQPPQAVGDGAGSTPEDHH